MKTCTHCGTEKPLSGFYTNKKGKPTPNCRDCIKGKSAAYRAANHDQAIASVKKWRKDNPEKSRASAKAWAENNPERKSANDRRWVLANPDKQRAAVRKWNRNNKPVLLAIQREWRKNNLGKDCAKVARRNATKLRAVPKWANHFYIGEIYELARLRSEATGVLHHVDHIYPLRSPLVCGLHCEANMQILTAVENIAKSNQLMDFGE